MPYGSLNLSDPRNRFSGLNPYLQQPQRAASTQQPPANQIEMQELRIRTQPPRPFIMEGSDNDEDIELGGAQQQRDFDSRIPQVEAEQLEEGGYFSCLGSYVSSAYQAIKSATSHLVCGQGTLTGEIYGTIGTSGTYPAFTLGSLPGALKTMGDSSFNPTTAGINAHKNFGLGTEWASTGSPSYNPHPFKDGSVGGLYGTITGGLSSAVGTLGSLSKLWDAGSAAKFSHDMRKAVNTIHQERVKLEGLRIQEPDEDDEDLPQIQVIEDNPQTLVQKLTILHTNVHDLLDSGLTLATETRAALGRDLATLGRMIQNDTWVEDLDEDDAAIFSQILERQITFQTHLEDSVRNFAQMKGVEGLSDLKEGGVGLLASLNGMANAIMTGISLVHPTGTPVGNELAAGLISTQALGSCFSCFTGCMGAYSDRADYTEAVELVAQSRQFRNDNPDSRMAPVSELVSRENEMRSGYKALTGTKNFIMGSSGTVLFSASLMGGVSAAAVVTPIGWALAGGASILGLYSAGVEKWWTKRGQEKDLKQEPQIQQRLEQESVELQSAMMELRHFEERGGGPLFAALSERLPTISESMGDLNSALAVRNQLNDALAAQENLILEANTGLSEALTGQKMAEDQCQFSQEKLSDLNSHQHKLDKSEVQLLKEISQSDKKQKSLHDQTHSLETDLNQAQETFRQIEEQIKEIPDTEENKQTLTQLNLNKTEQSAKIENLQQLLSEQLGVEQKSREKHTQLTQHLVQVHLDLAQVGSEIKITGQTLSENQSELVSCISKVDSQKLRLHEARERHQILSNQQEEQAEIIHHLDQNLGDHFEYFGGVQGLREAVEKGGFQGAYECLLDQRSELAENRNALIETFQAAQRTVSETENELKRSFPTSAVRAIIEDLRSGDPITQTGAKAFVRDVLGVAEESVEMRVIELGERAYAAELLLSKLGLAYLS